MQDPVKTIKDVLNTNWINDASVLDKDVITWRFGPPEDPKTRFNEFDISMEFDFLTAPREKRSLARSVVRKVVTVDIWMHIDADDVLETMFTAMQTAADKVDSVIKANQRSLTNLDLAHVGPERNLDRPEDKYLRRQFEIVCQYQV